jgi:DNA polymerase-3 subunit delta'
VIESVLLAEGVGPAEASQAAASSNGNLDRARVLALDTGLALRREAFHRLPHRLDGTGAEVARAVEELLGLIDAAAEPMKQRQAYETDALERRVEQLGERGSGRKEMAERHRRELRRHRTDELKAGLHALGTSYRDQLAEGTAHDPLAAVTAVADLQAAMEALDRNANESLLLQSLLLRLPPA